MTHSELLASTPTLALPAAIRLAVAAILSLGSAVHKADLAVASISMTSSQPSLAAKGAVPLAAEEVDEPILFSRRFSLVTILKCNLA
jgi:hypothetical protein